MNFYGRRSLIFLILLLMSITVVAAQGGEPGLGSRDCPVVVSRSEPQQIINGQTNTLSVFGSGFSETAAVRLGGYGVLPTTRVNSGVLTAEIPANIPPGTYNVRLVDPECSNINYPEQAKLKLTVSAAPLPTATFGVPEEPTPIPGQPALLARNFSANPATVKPGDTVTLVFEIYNQGNRTAQGISASLDAGGVFLPSGGQATVILPDIAPGGTATVTLAAIVAESAEAGPASVPVTISYRDFTGESYTSTASLSVTIERVIRTTQVILSRYQYSPDPVIPGEPTSVRVTVTNLGNIVASQALIRVAGEGVLLAGTQGDTFPLLDIQAGASATLDLPLIVKPGAEAGPQAQPFTITYLLNGEAQTVDGTMTITVARVVEQSPVMLLQSYGVDRDPLKPGEQFELTVELKNVGDVTAIGTLVTFGTVETSNDGSGGDNSGNGGSNTTPSTTFAPLGTGGTLFIGDLAAGDVMTFTQEFIVNGTTVSGVYSVPITLRYQKPSGGTVQDNLKASVVVIKPPAIRIAAQFPPPEFVNVGDPITLAYDLFNNGTKTLDLTNATTEAENGEVIDGAELFIGQIPVNDQGTYTSTVIPSAEGTTTITVTFRYLDDLNNEREIVETFEITVMEPPPMPTEESTPDIILPIPTPEPTQDNSDWLGRLLLGLLGLGS